MRSASLLSPEEAKIQTWSADITAVSDIPPPASSFPFKAHVSIQSPPHIERIESMVITTYPTPPDSPNVPRDSKDIVAFVTHDLKLSQKKSDLVVWKEENEEIPSEISMDDRYKEQERKNIEQLLRDKSQAYYLCCLRDRTKLNQEPPLKGYILFQNNNRSIRLVMADLEKLESTNLSLENAMFQKMLDEMQLFSERHHLSLEQVTGPTEIVDRLNTIMSTLRRQTDITEKSDNPIISTENITISIESPFEKSVWNEQEEQKKWGENHHTPWDGEARKVIWEANHSGQWTGEAKIDELIIQTMLCVDLNNKDTYSLHTYPQPNANLSPEIELAMAAMFINKLIQLIHYTFDTIYFRINGSEHKTSFEKYNSDLLALTDALIFCAHQADLILHSEKEKRFIAIRDNINTSAVRYTHESLIDDYDRASSTDFLRAIAHNALQDQEYTDIASSAKILLDKLNLQENARLRALIHLDIQTHLSEQSPNPSLQHYQLMAFARLTLDDLNHTLFLHCKKTNGHVPIEKIRIAVISEQLLEIAKQLEEKTSGWCNFFPGIPSKNFQSIVKAAEESFTDPVIKNILVKMITLAIHPRWDADPHRNAQTKSGKTLLDLLNHPDNHRIRLCLFPPIDLSSEEKHLPNENIDTHKLTYHDLKMLVAANNLGEVREVESTRWCCGLINSRAYTV